MNKILIMAIVMITIITTISITLISVTFSNDYEFLSNEELINITNAAYIQGALYTSQTENIPYNNNGTLGEISIQQVCQNLNNMEVQS